ncbi:MAG: hypothetical protein RDA78_23025 [Roseibium sp.]|uniref:DUF6931 family protein n=1 Tax=Roseibium sp. TaxID=1936156 RepID=UPI003D9BFF1D
MGSRIRFTSANQVFQTYPDLGEDLDPPASDISPQDFALDILKGEDPYAAILFFAHALPKREAVWWGLRCVIGLDQGKTTEDMKLLELVTSWVQDGDEEARLAVQAATDDFVGDSPSLWIGRAASLSGGSLSPNPEFRVDTLPHLTAVCASGAVQLAITGLRPGPREEAIGDCISAGISFAEGGAMPVVLAKQQAAV